MNKYLTLIFLVLVSILIGFPSCVDSKKLIYFNNIPDTTIVSSDSIPEPLIQSNDILDISVSSINPEASSIFNLSNVQTPLENSNDNTNLSFAKPLNSTSGSLINGYLVDFAGNIQFPVLGEIHAKGLTEEQLKDTISSYLINRKLLVDPIVMIRNITFKVTVLGEVLHPTVINVTTDRISILEALGQAGDLTIYGKRNNVLLIRDNGSKKIIQHIDLNSPDLLVSPFYYLRPNDVIYVSPNKAKINSSRNYYQLFPFIISSLSFLAIIFSYIIYQTK